MNTYTQHKQSDVRATKGTKGFNATSRARPNERSNLGGRLFFGTYKASMVRSEQHVLEIVSNNIKNIKF